jgi:hypothetical protein
MTFLLPVRQCGQIALLASLLLAASVRAQTLPCDTGQDPLGSECPYTPSQRLRDYVTRTAGPRALFNASFGASIQQARGAPYAWGGGSEGYTRRYGSNMGKRAISNTVQLGVEAMLGQDSRYVPSEQTGFWPRTKDAIKHSFLVRSGDGGRQLAIGRIAGAFGGGLLSRTWQPAGHDDASDGLRSAGISFSGYLGGNVFREFWPALRDHLPF